MLFGHADKLHVASLNVVRYDQLITASSMEYELDVSHELWMTKGRFTGLMRDYLEPEAVEKFIRQSGELPPKRASLSQMMCRVKPKTHPLKYRWGNCILGMTFRSGPGAPTLSMHSRTTAITRMGGLDLALAHVIGQGVAQERGENVEDYAFTWHVGAVQHSAMGGVPYFYSHGYGKYLDQWRDEFERFPGLVAMKRQADYFDDLDRRGIVSVFGTRRRIREQRRAYLNGTLKRPAVPLTKLNLDPLAEGRR
jgi:hypothetical protein